MKYRSALALAAQAAAIASLEHDHWRSDRKPECNCYSPWMSVTPPPPCPVHGRAEMSGVRVEWAR